MHDKMKTLYVFTVMVNHNGINEEKIAMSFDVNGNPKPLVFVSDKELDVTKKDIQKMVNAHHMHMQLIQYQLVERIESYIPEAHLMN